MDPEEFFIPEWTKPVILPNGVETTGIFSSKGAEITFGIGIDASRPSVVLREVDATALREGDILIIADQEFYAKTFDPPDEGLAVIYLGDDV